MKVALLTLAWLVSVACAFAVGTQVGAYQYVVSSANNDAMIATSRLKMLDSGRQDELRSTMNIELQAALGRHADYPDSWFRFLFPLIDENADRNMREAARYRDLHPYTPPPVPTYADPDVARRMTEGNRQLEQQVARVLERYRQ